MQPSLLNGTAIHAPLAFERAMMRDLGWDIAAAPASISWSGLGANDFWTTTANWVGGTVPRGGDSVSFGASPRTMVDVNFEGGANSAQQFSYLNTITFAADAPAYTIHFIRQRVTELTGGGIDNQSSQPQTIVVENGFANSPNRSGATLKFNTGTAASNARFEVRGGGTDIEHPPNLPPRYVRGAGGSVVFEGTARAGSASFTVDGGQGDEGPQGTVVFRGTASAGRASFRNKAGHFGVRLPSGFASGFGGETRFEGNSNAGTTAHFQNDGEAESIGGTGGITTFADDASAGDATFDNLGVSVTAGFGALGGFTRFLDRSTASTADFINRESALSNIAHGMGETQFWDDAKAGTATFTNMGGTLEGRVGGVTRFRDRSTAENGRFTNLGGGFKAGGTEFYDDSNAGRGTFLFPFNPPGAALPVGSGRTEFFDRSVASAESLPRAEYTFGAGAAANSIGGGGAVWFHDNSRAGLARFTFETFSKGTVYFTDQANADRAEFVLQDQSYGKIWFDGHSSASDRTYDITAGGQVVFSQSATAAGSTITIQNGSSGVFGQPQLLTDSASAGNATIRVIGGTLTNPPGLPVGGRLRFNEGSTAGDANITIEGGTGAAAPGARLTFAGGSFWPTTAGNATVTVNGGANGGQGGIVIFSGGAQGGTATLVANAGGTFDFSDQRNFGGTSVGAIGGAGQFILQGSLLTTGLHDSTFSGQITDGGTPGGQLTKVGAGTFALSGDNTYTGLTTVASGTLRVDGSIAGDVLVKNGARLEGRGRIPRAPTVEAGGFFAPGASPGTITIGGITMLPGSVLEYEIGQTARDRIVVTDNGSISLGGTLRLVPLDDAPTLGQSFSLFEGAVGSLAGSFDEIIAPTFNGLTLNIAQGGNAVVLQVAPDTTEKTWGVDANGTVSVGNNWAGGAAPLTANDSAAFTNVITEDRAVQLDVPLNLRSVRFDDDNGYTLQGETLTLQAPGAAPAVIQARNLLGNGAHTITAPLLIASDLGVVQQSTGVLTLAGPLDNSAGGTITKSGSGTLTVAGTQVHGPGSALNVSAGVVNLQSDAGQDMSRNLTVNADSTTSFGATQHLAALNIGPGAVATMVAGGTKNLVTTALSINGGASPTGKLDVNDNTVIVDFPSSGPNPEATIRAQIIAGRGAVGLGATWEGSVGIASSTAALDVLASPESTSIAYAFNSELPLGAFATFRGQAVDPSTVFITYTLTGDANLDGTVNDDDVTIIGASYAPGVANASWALGDFDYNGFVDDDDVTLLGAFYDPSAAPLMVIESSDVAAVASVPEPTSWLLAMGGLAIGLLSWQRLRLGNIDSDKHLFQERLTTRNGGSHE
jgi:autotransporter-associated beta strand protein